MTSSPHWHADADGYYAVPDGRGSGSGSACRSSTTPARPSYRQLRELIQFNRRNGGSVAEAYTVWHSADRESEEVEGRSSGMSMLERLRAAVPRLSTEFKCSEDDAYALVGALLSPQRGDGTDFEGKIATLQAEVNLTTAKLERRDEDCEKLRDEVGELKQKMKALEAQAQQRAALLSQKREEVRRQLLQEESRSNKLQQQNKVLTLELDKLKGRVHLMLK